MTIAPFPTDYQLDQIGKLVLVDRTRPWMLNKYFDAAHFRVVDKPMDQQTLFAELCQQLLEEGFVDAEFHASVVEREAIVSTMLGMALRCRTPWGCWRKRRWFIPLSPRRASPGRRNRPSHFPARYQQARV